MAGKCYFLNLGTVGYTQASKLQLKLVEARKKGHGADLLIFLEHPPVFTVGRGGGLENILADQKTLENENIQVHLTNRGGNVTYHGPGQLVGYPLLDLRNYGRDIHFFVRCLEETLIRTAKHFGVNTARISNLPGVWAGNNKLAAIGVHVDNWVTSHGFAMNVTTDLGHYRLIVPCGIENRGVTSLSEILGRKIDDGEVRSQAAKHFSQVFRVTLEELAPGDVSEHFELPDDAFGCVYL